MPECDKHHCEMYPEIVEVYDAFGEPIGTELDNWVCPECEWEAHEAERKAFEEGMNGDE